MSSTEPVAPAAIEAGTAETIDVTWQDLKVTVPATLDDWDGDAVEALEKMHAMTAIRAVLGNEQREQLPVDFRKAHGRKMTAKDWGELLREIMSTGYGVELGE